MSCSPLPATVLRMDLPLWPGSITIIGAAAVGEGVGTGVGVTLATGVATGLGVGVGATGVGLGLGVVGSGEKTVWGGVGSNGRATGSEEPQPVTASRSPAATTAAAALTSRTSVLR